MSIIDSAKEIADIIKKICGSNIVNLNHHLKYKIKPEVRMPNVRRPKSGIIKI